MILEGKKLLITGVVNRRSIAFSIAERAQEEGAEVVLTSFGRIKRMTERSAARLPQPPDVLEGHVTATLCHMANISYRLGRKESPARIAEVIAGNDTLAEAFERCLKHLKANEVDLKREPMTIGPSLKFDRESERFVGEFSDMANMYLRRNYREPFVVPDEV